MQPGWWLKRRPRVHSSRCNQTIFWAVNNGTQDSLASHETFFFWLGRGAAHLARRLALPEPEAHNRPIIPDHKPHNFIDADG